MSLEHVSWDDHEDSDDGVSRGCDKEGGMRTRKKKIGEEEERSGEDEMRA